MQTLRAVVSEERSCKFSYYLETAYFGVTCSLFFFLLLNSRNPASPVETVIVSGLNLLWWQFLTSVWNDEGVVSWLPYTLRAWVIQHSCCCRDFCILLTCCLIKRLVCLCFKRVLFLNSALLASWWNAKHGKLLGVRIFVVYPKSSLAGLCGGFFPKIFRFFFWQSSQMKVEDTLPYRNSHFVSLWWGVCFPSESVCLQIASGWKAGTQSRSQS